MVRYIPTRYEIFRHGTKYSDTVRNIPTWYEKFRHGTKHSDSRYYIFRHLCNASYVPYSEKFHYFLRPAAPAPAPPPAPAPCGTYARFTIGTIYSDNTYDIFRHYVPYIPTLSTIYSDFTYDIFRHSYDIFRQCVRYIPTLCTMYSDIVYCICRHCIRTRSQRNKGAPEKLPDLPHDVLVMPSFPTVVSREEFDPSRIRDGHAMILGQKAAPSCRVSNDSKLLIVKMYGAKTCIMQENAW